MTGQSTPVRRPIKSFVVRGGRLTDSQQRALEELWPRYGVPFSGATKFVAIGLNYSDHAAETGNPVPKEPIVFHKTLSCMQGPDDDVMLPKNSVKTDWEVELGIVIGTRARYVSKKSALDYVAGYVLVNDVSEREWQSERGPTWD